MSRSLRVRMISESEFTVQGHGVHTAHVELCRALDRRDDVRLMVNARGDADVTHIHTAGAYSLWFLLFASGSKVVTAHVVPDSFVGSLIGARYWLWLAKWYFRWFYNRADLVLAVSNETKEDLRQLGVRAPIEVFHNVIDTSRYVRADDDRSEARKQLSIDYDSFVVVGSGQVQPRKRVDVFINLAKELPEVSFVWVGGMPFGKAAADHQQMQRMIDTAPRNMRFTGVVPLEDVRRYYLAADVFLLPSVQETFGLVVVEAAAAGLPIILRDLPDYDETFRVDAIMSDEAGFASILKRLMTDSAYYAAACRSASHIAERFDSVAGGERLVELYHSVAAKR